MIFMVMHRKGWRLSAEKILRPCQVLTPEPVAPMATSSSFFSSMAGLHGEFMVIQTLKRKG